ncbi:MAG TPA: hypothetical protein DCZ95_10715 [Verrucomicrobia bacterium]|nr:MAG: hypothetical protein A2X46_18430 [Lentisphaerae bacterium GWF2_57_35]HBA84555.1 hypothetical protein [Verrucomicrobiota bacterium]
MKAGFQQIMSRIDRLTALIEHKNIEEAAQLVDEHRAELALDDPLYPWLKRAWPLLRYLRPETRRQPCLYLCLLFFARACRLQQDARINVCLSAHQTEMNNGHCWLTIDGETIPLSPSDRDHFGECLGGSQWIRYWVRFSLRSRNPHIMARLKHITRFLHKGASHG